MPDSIYQTFKDFELMENLPDEDVFLSRLTSKDEETNFDPIVYAAKSNLAFDLILAFIGKKKLTDEQEEQMKQYIKAQNFSKY